MGRRAEPEPAGSPERGSAAGRPSDDEIATGLFTRRRFLRNSLAAGGALAVGAVVVGISEEPAGSPVVSTVASTRPTTPTSLQPAAPLITPQEEVTLTALPGGATVPVSAAVVAENRRPGQAWWVTTAQSPGAIEGFASQVSAVPGDTVTLFVNTQATQFHVEAYRLGYYQGIGGRMVWQSDPAVGVRQPAPELNPWTNTVQCQWTPSLSIPIDAGWPAGAYLLKLVGTTGEQQHVPLCIRDDASRAAVVIQQSVTTWQAYNRWGGYSLYYGNKGSALTYTQLSGDGTYDDRARVVSFDRPYPSDWASGAADAIGNEFPVIYHAERMGLDVTYWTDVDLHAQPELLTTHKGLVSLGHDEYWSAEMRDGADQALADGVNFAFLGANACYRQIRLQPSPVGPNRLQVCYKSAAEDPMTAQQPTLATVNWPEAPVSRPESELIGSTYQDIEAQADMVVVDPSAWALAGVTLPPDHRLPGVVRGEFDRYVPGGGGPDNLDVIAHSVVANRNNNYSDVTWYTVPGGGGVFATGNASWVGALSDSTLVPPNLVPKALPGVTAPLQRMMENVYSVIGVGPAGLSHPSTGTWRSAYQPGSVSAAAPDVTTSA